MSVKMAREGGQGLLNFCQIDVPSKLVNDGIIILNSLSHVVTTHSLQHTYVP